MNALRTEDDLRDALDQLSSGAPAVDAVLPRVDRPRRKVAWIAPLAAALLVLVVAAVVVVHRSSSHSPAAGPPPAQLIGRWRLESVGSQLAGGRAAMHIDADGKFWADVPTCGPVRGQMRVSGSSWWISSVRSRLSWCPMPAMTRSQARRAEAIAEGVRHMFTNVSITWSLSVDRLTLRRPGVPTLVYFRVDRPHTLPAH